MPANFHICRGWHTSPSLSRVMEWGSKMSFAQTDLCVLKHLSLQELRFCERFTRLSGTRRKLLEPKSLFLSPFPLQQQHSRCCSQNPSALAKGGRGELNSRAVGMSHCSDYLRCGFHRKAKLSQDWE